MKVRTKRVGRGRNPLEPIKRKSNSGITYSVLLQKDKKALGVLKKQFTSSGEIDDYIDTNYPNYFYSRDFTDSDRVKEWIKKFGYYKKGNPDTNAVEKMSEDFHGRKTKFVTEIEERESFDDNVAELADLEELGVLCANYVDRFNISFKKDRPKLVCAIVTGKQELDRDWETLVSRS